MKTRHAFTIKAGVARLVLLGCAASFVGSSAQNVDVQYGEVLADKNDVRIVRQIVSRERRSALARAVRRRDIHSFQQSIRQLAFGRLRRVTGTWWGGSPAAVAFYEDTRNPRHSVEYAVYYHKGHWRFAGSSQYDANYGRLRKGDLASP